MIIISQYEIIRTAGRRQKTAFFSLLEKGSRAADGREAKRVKTLVINRMDEKNSGRFK